MLGRVDSFDFVAPFVFDWEVHNILFSTGRNVPSVYADLLERLEGLGVRVGQPFGVEAALALAIQAKLSLFDAAYLREALEQSLPLVSRDSRLVEAAIAYGVFVHDLR